MQYATTTILSKKLLLYQTIMETQFLSITKLIQTAVSNELESVYN